MDGLGIGIAKNDFSITDTNVQYTSYYSGIFDGNKKTISNFKVNSSSTDKTVALFGAVKDGRIENCIINVDIVGNQVIGGLVGYMNNSAISNCKVTGTIKGKYGVGGIAGFIDNKSVILGCKNVANITTTASNNHGGIAGVVKNNSEVQYCYNMGTITNNYTSSDVTAKCNDGGIVGRIDTGGSIKYVYNKGSINTKNTNTGGIVGNITNPGNSGITIANCYNLADVIGGTGIDIGGIIGNGVGKSTQKIYVRNVYNKGAIKTGKNVGGIIGYADYLTLEGEILNYGSVSGGTTYTAAIIGNYLNGTLNFTKRAYGGNCSSTLKCNGNGSTMSYEANLVMPTVYSVVNASNANIFTTTGASADAPILKNIE